MVLTEIRERALVQLAKDIYAEKVFTTQHIHPSEIQSMLPLIFMPLVFLDPKETVLPDNIVMIYEYYTKAVGGRAINGYPVFGSMMYLNQEEFDYMQTKYTEIKNTMDGI